MSYTNNKVTPLRSRKKEVSKNRQTLRNGNNKKTQISPPTKLAYLREQRKNTPAWLKSFRLLENGSFLVAFILICSTLTLYSWTVLTQQTWSKQYRNLESLQRQERDFLATSETLKQQLVEESQNKDSNLIPATPGQSIFIDSAPTKFPFNNQKPEENYSIKNNNLPPIKRPLGY